VSGVSNDSNFSPIGHGCVLVLIAVKRNVTSVPHSTETSDEDAAEDHKRRSGPKRLTVKVMSHARTSFHGEDLRAKRERS
jgi:hypothetical protein